MEKQELKNVNVQQLQTTQRFLDQIGDAFEVLEMYGKKVMEYANSKNTLSKNKKFMKKLGQLNMGSCQMLNLLAVTIETLHDKNDFKSISLGTNKILEFYQKLNTQNTNNIYRIQVLPFILSMITMLQGKSFETIPPPKITNESFNINTVEKTINQWVKSQKLTNKRDKEIEDNKILYNNKHENEFNANKTKNNYEEMKNMKINPNSINQNTLLSNFNKNDLNTDFRRNNNNNNNKRNPNEPDLWPQSLKEIIDQARKNVNRNKDFYDYLETEKYVRNKISKGSLVDFKWYNGKYYLGLILNFNHKNNNFRINFVNHTDEAPKNLNLEQRFNVHRFANPCSISEMEWPNKLYDYNTCMKAFKQNKLDALFNPGYMNIQHNGFVKVKIIDISENGWITFNSLNLNEKQAHYVHLADYHSVKLKFSGSYMDQDNKNNTREKDNEGDINMSNKN